MWKTVSARLRGAEAELKAMGEDTEGLVETTSKLRGLVKGMTGFDIMEDEDTYKSIYDIVVGIGEKWSELTDIQQASLLESLAGKLQSNRLAAALQNVDQIKEIYKTAEDSAGSAMKEQEHYAESVQYSLDSFKASAESLASTFLKSDFLKGLVDTGSKALDIIEKLLDAIGSFPAVASVASLALDKMMDISIFSRKKGEYGEDIGLQNNMSTDGIKDFFKKNFTAQPIFSESEINALQKYSEMIARGDDATKAFDATLKDARPTVQDFAKSTDDLSGALSNIPKQNKAVTFLKSFGTSLLNMGAIALVSVGISALISVLDKLIVTSKEASKAMDSLSSAIENLDSQHSINLQTINSVKDRYYELSEGVNDLGNNVSLTTDEYEEYKGIISQISDTMPQLTARYNEQGEKVGFLTGQIKDLNKELAEQEQLEYSKLLANGEDGQGENIDTILKGIAKDYNDTKSNVIYNNPISNLFKSAKNFIAGKGFQNDPYLSDDGGMTKKIQETRDEIDKLEQSVKNLEETGVPKIVNGDALTDDSTTNLQKQQEEIKKYNAELVTTRANLQKLYAQRQVDAQALSNLGKLYSKTNKEYVKLDEDQKSYIDSVLSNISPEEVDDLIEKAKDAGVTLDAYMSSYANNIVELFSDNKNGVNSLMDKLLNFDFSDMSDAEIQQKVNELLSRISEILGIDSNELKIRLGFEFVDENARDAELHMRQIATNNNGMVDEVSLSNMHKWADELNLTNEQLEHIEKSGYKASDGFEELKKAVKKADKEIERFNKNKIDIHIDTVDKAKTDLGTLTDSYADYKDGGGTVDVNKLNSVSDNMKNINGSTEAYQKFLDVLTEVPEDTAKVQEAYNELVTAYIDGQDVLQNLTVANLEYTTSELEKMGVTNAEEVAMSRLAQSAETTADKTAVLQYAVDNLTDATDRAKYANIDFANSDVDTIISLAKEEGISDSLRKSLVALAFQKMSVNNVSILTTGDINNMIAMAKQAGIAVNALERLANAKSALNGNSKASKNMKTKSATANHNAEQGIEAEARKSAEQAQHEVDRISNGDVGDTADYGGGGNTTNSKTGSSKNTSPKKTKAKKTKKTKKSMSLTKTIYNWIERKLDVVAKKADRAQERIDRLLDWDKKRNATLKALEAVEKQLDENYKASKRYYSYAKSQAKAEMKDAVAQVKKEGSKSQKKKYGKNLSQKTMDKYMNLVEEGKIGGEDIQAIKDPRIKAFVDAYIEWYEKAKAVDDTINSLTDDVRDLYEQLANNPLDKCAEQVEKLGNAMTVLEGKSTNAIYKMNTAFVNMAKSVTKSTDLIGKTYYDMGTTLSDVIPNEVFDTIIENRDEKYKNLIATLNEYAIAAGNAMSNSASSVKKFETSQKQVLDLFSGKSAKDLGVTDEVLKSMKEQVANGELIDPDLITLFNKNTEVQNALKNYLNAYIENEAMQKALEKATSDYEIKNQETTTDIINNNLEALTKTDNYLQHQLDLFNAQESALAGQVALMEQYGKVYDRANYDKQIEIEQKEYDAIIKARNQQMALLATIPEEADQWYETRDLINAYNDKLLECEGNMYSLKEAANSIADSLYEMYEVLNTRINNELQFFIDMMEEVEDFDPVTHMATDEGLARLYLYSAQMGNINSLIDQDKKKIIEYNEAIAKAEADGSERIKATIMGSVVDWTLSEAKDKVDEAYDSLMDHEKEFHALKNNMIEWEISKLEEELNLAQEIVDARKDALTAEKNLHDYQRSIQDATQNINNLQKQITVVRGDTSQEGKARVQALQKQLRDAQKNLEETEYERYISAEQEMLDNLMEEYTTLVDEEKTHREELYERAKLDIITNADKITSTIDTAVSELGVTPQYTSDVTTWLKDNKVTELSASLTTAIDNQRKSIIKALTGSEESNGSNSVFGSINGLSGKFDAFTTYKTDVDSTFKSLNTTMTSLQNKTFTAIVDTDTITNKIIAEIAKSKVVASNDEVIDVTANPEDPTNGGGTGSGGGNTGNNGSGKIFTNSTETPNSLSDGKVNSTNGTHLPTQSAKTPEEVFNQIQDQSDFEKRKKASEVATFLKNLTDSEGQTLVQNDGVPKSNMNKFVYNYTQDANGKGLILKKAGYTKLYEMLGIPDSSENKADEAYKALLELGFHAPDMSELDSVNAVTRFMASKKHGHGLKKKYEEYGAVNQLLYSAYNKVLDDADLKELSLVLGKKYTDSSFNGWLFNSIWNRVKVLIPKFKDMTPQFDKNKKQLYFSGLTGGFAKGGIVDYVHGQGEDGIAMVRQGEGILTPAQTKTFMYELAPRMDDIIDASKLIKDTTANLDKIVPMGETNVEATFQFDLENVTNAGDIIKQIQTNNNVQKAIQSVTIDRIAGGSRLGVNKF